MLSWGHMGAPFYIIPSPKLAPDFWNSGSLVLVEWKSDSRGWYPPQTTSHIHIGYTQSVWGICVLSHRHMGAPLYCSTGQVGSRFWSFESLLKWTWCNYIMVEAYIYLRLLPTSILDMYKVFEVMLCCLTGISVHPNIALQAKLAPDFWNSGSLVKFLGHL